MTACAVLASSANADSQVFTGVVNQQPGMFQPYHANVMPINPAGYTNSFGMTTPVTLPLTHVGPALQTLNTYGMGQVTQMGMVPTFGFGHNLFKREARLETPYTIQTRMDNPLDGSKQEVQIKVNKFGKGKSFQHVEQTDETNVMRDNYMLEHRRMAQRPLISKNRYLLAGSRPITQRGMDMNNQRGMDIHNHMGMDQVPRDHFFGMNHPGQHFLYLDESEGTLDPSSLDEGLVDSLVRSGPEETIDNLGGVIKQAHELWETAKAKNLMDMRENLREAFKTLDAKTENLRNMRQNLKESRQNLKESFEAHNDLGEFLKEAMVMIKSAKPEQEDNLDYLQATKLIPKYNIWENFMAYPQNQMIHTQRMRI